RGKAPLQHGSILLAYDPWFWWEVWAEEPGTAAVDKAALSGKVIGLEEALGMVPDRMAVIAALRQGLSEVLGISWEEGFLTAEERRLATQLQREKYANPAWNNRRGRSARPVMEATPSYKEEARG